MKLFYPDCYTTSGGWFSGLTFRNDTQRCGRHAKTNRICSSVVSSSSGEEAVEYLKTNKVDLLLLDMIMDPGMDGLDTYKKIIALHPGQKAIIASGFSETDRARELQNLGAGAYIAKPFLLEKIGLAIKEELEKRASFDVQNLTLQETKSCFFFFGTPRRS